LCSERGQTKTIYEKLETNQSSKYTENKLASSCIAERIKSVLQIIISNDKIGFILDRYIGEHTLLIYDILHFTEEQEIPGILLLVYIEKAFSSISWMFIESVLDFFNFGFSIKQWAKICYANITSAVLFAFVLA
jgi:hypothetical protein